MSHDPLCSVQDDDPPPLPLLCICGELSAARRDMLAKCIAVLEALPPITHVPVAHPHEGCLDPTIHMIWTPVVGVPDLLAALRALQTP